MPSGGLGCGGVRMVGDVDGIPIPFTQHAQRLHDARTDDRRDALGTLDWLNVIKQTQVHG